MHKIHTDAIHCIAILLVSCTPLHALPVWNSIQFSAETATSFPVSSSVYTRRPKSAHPGGISLSSENFNAKSCESRRPALAGAQSAQWKVRWKICPPPHERERVRGKNPVPNVTLCTKAKRQADQPARKRFSYFDKCKYCDFWHSSALTEGLLLVGSSSLFFHPWLKSNRALLRSLFFFVRCISVRRQCCLRLDEIYGKAKIQIHFCIPTLVNGWLGGERECVSSRGSTRVGKNKETLANCQKEWNSIFISHLMPTIVLC